MLCSDVLELLQGCQKVPELQGPLSTCLAKENTTLESIIGVSSQSSLVEITIGIRHKEKGTASDDLGHVHKSHKRRQEAAASTSSRSHTPPPSFSMQPSLTSTALNDRCALHDPNQWVQ